MGSITSRPWPPDPRKQPTVKYKRKLVLVDGKLVPKLVRTVEHGPVSESGRGKS